MDEVDGLLKELTIREEEVKAIDARLATDRTTANALLLYVEKNEKIYNNYIPHNYVFRTYVNSNKTKPNKPLSQRENK